MYWSIIGVIKGDTRSLDYGSCCFILDGFVGAKQAQQN